MPAATPEIDAVLAELAVVVDEARAARSRTGYFAALYQQVTVAVKAGVEEGLFDDGPRMSRFDARFARRYLGAAAAWKAGRPLARCWKVAFTAAARSDRLILQHLLLGINAHINLDLAIAAAEVSPGRAIAGLEADFNRINDVLAALSGPAQDVVARHSPLIGLLDQVGGRSDEAVLDFSLAEARRDAWAHAMVLAGLDAEGRRREGALVDRKVAFLSRLIENPGGLSGHAVALISFTESRDTVAVIDDLQALAPAPALAALALAGPAVA